MNPNRMLRVGEELKKELARILTGESDEHRKQFFTVTEVRVTKDLRYADVWVSVMGDDGHQKAAMVRLLADSFRLRKALAGRVYLRRMPELRFHHDATLEYADPLARLLIEGGILLGTGEEHEQII